MNTENFKKHDVMPNREFDGYYINYTLINHRYANDNKNWLIIVILFKPYIFI